MHVLILILQIAAGILLAKIVIVYHKEIVKFVGRILGVALAFAIWMSVGYGIAKWLDKDPTDYMIGAAILFVLGGIVSWEFERREAAEEAAKVARRAEQDEASEEWRRYQKD